MFRLEDVRAMSFLLGHFSLPHWRVILALVVASLGSATLATLQPLLLAPALDTAVATSTPPARSISELTLNNVGPTILRTVTSGTPDPFLIVVVVALVYVVAVGALSVLNFLAYRFSVHLRILTIMDMQKAQYAHV